MKKVIILIICIMLIILPINTVNANPLTGPLISGAEAVTEILSEGLWGWFLQDDSHMDTDIELGKTQAITSSKAMTGRIFRIMQVLGSVLSVIALLIIGIRYMFSSIEDRASMKGILIYYVIGAVLVFATSNILSIAYSLISGLSI
jgi:hypothetical protein